MSSGARADRTVVHLVRHGEVENPTGVLYGRLEGFGLSALGELGAREVAEHLRHRDVVMVSTSPLERARRTAAPLAELLGVTAVVDDRLIEASNVLEGRRVDVRRSVLRQPSLWPALWNPWRPSWGEPFRDVADRMWRAVCDARAAACGHEAVLVSHEMPIWVTRRRAEGRRLAHDPRRRQCALTSVTSLRFEHDQVVEVSYRTPTLTPS